MSKVFVLDACALIAILKNEDGADTVAAAYKKLKMATLKLSSIG